MPRPTQVQDSPAAALAELDRLERERQQHESDRKRDRRFERFTLRGEAELHPVGDDRLDAGAARVKLRDLGIGGIGFISDRRIASDTIWRMVFLQSGYAVAEQTVIVRHCASVSAGLWLCGGQFVAPHGLLVAMGIDPADLHRPAGDEDVEFLDPSGLG
ncbi:MAG: hypothetical protein AAF612_02720 [Planctomycetota bacterium]